MTDPVQSLIAAASLRAAVRARQLAHEAADDDNRNYCLMAAAVMERRAVNAQRME